MIKGKTLQEAEQELKDAEKSNDEIAKLAQHKVIQGNKPSNTMVLDKLTPSSLGALIAMYEHKVFVQGIIWGINSFDQWGVELGKTLETGIYQAIKSNEISGLDASTRGLMNLVFKD